jgi:hypothetical protein
MSLLDNECSISKSVSVSKNLSDKATHLIAMLDLVVLVLNGNKMKVFDNNLIQKATMTASDQIFALDFDGTAICIGLDNTTPYVVIYNTSLQFVRLIGQDIFPDQAFYIPKNSKLKLNGDFIYTVVNDDTINKISLATGELLMSITTTPIACFDIVSAECMVTVSSDTSVMRVYGLNGKFL